MIYFLKLTLPQYYFSHSFLQQAFTRKSKNSNIYDKVLEKIVHKRLLLHLLENEILIINLFYLANQLN